MAERIIWLNGTFRPESEAQISIFDRGLLFADALYEGMGVLDGQIIDFPFHWERLSRGLEALDFPQTFSQAALYQALNDLIRHNGLGEGFLYLHVTRGVQERDYLPAENLEPNVFAFTQPQAFVSADQPPKGLKMASVADLRWARRDLKTSNLLGQVLAKREAAARGADEALMLDAQGMVTEGGSASFFIISGQTLLARPLHRDLLPGVTRRAMLMVMSEAGLTLEERAFSLEEAYGADEAILTGSSSYIEPVTEIDGRPVGAGLPGPFALRLRAVYLEAVRTRMR